MKFQSYLSNLVSIVSYLPRKFRSLNSAAIIPFQLTACLLTYFISLTANAFTTTWESSDDSNWIYTATLSNASIQKISSIHLGSELKPLATPVITKHCMNGASRLFPDTLYSWCYYNTANPMTSFLDSMPYVHWFFVEQPSPTNPYWAGSVLRLAHSEQFYGPDFTPTVLAGTAYQEGDQLTYFRVWNHDITWDAKEGGHIIYISKTKIEADMFGKKTISQGTIKQKLHLTDPVISGDNCCDTGVFEHSITYDIKLERIPLLITLPSHVDMGEIPVGSDSEVHMIPVTVSSNNKPVAITPGIANISFEQVNSLTSNNKNAQCNATLLVSNDIEQVNSGEVVDLHSFYNGIAVKVANTSGCQSGAYSGALSFTVSWK